MFELALLSVTQYRQRHLLYSRVKQSNLLYSYGCSGLNSILSAGTANIITEANVPNLYFLTVIKTFSNPAPDSSRNVVITFV
jgi:hypothetical protein